RDRREPVARRCARGSTAREQRQHTVPGLLGRLAERLTGRLGLLLCVLVGLLQVLVGAFGQVEHGLWLTLVIRFGTGRRLSCLWLCRLGDATAVLRRPRHTLDGAVAVEHRAALDATGGVATLARQRRQAQPRQRLAPRPCILNDAAIDGVGLRARHAVFLCRGRSQANDYSAQAHACNDQRPAIGPGGDVS